MTEAALSLAKKRVNVHGRTMSYVEAGQGDPIVFLHGNPTSSYIWRNVIPHVRNLGRCVAPDLIGMGDSDKLPNSGPGSYSFVEHRSYLDALLGALSITDRVTFVLHNWGSALGFDWARRHPDAVMGLAYMEAIVSPLAWQDLPPQLKSLLEALRSPAGEQMVLTQNVFVEQVLPSAMLRTLSPDEMEHYRLPFSEPGESRRPTLSWPRQIPIDGEPRDVAEIVSSYANWLTHTPIPKLFIKGEPGAALAGGRLADACRTWPAQTEVAVKGLHFLQEDSPDQIGLAIAEWLARLSDGWTGSGAGPAVG
jgi:haloalkane dehalogenase